jgi:hypothetical protein
VRVRGREERKEKQKRSRLSSYLLAAEDAREDAAVRVARRQSERRVDRGRVSRGGARGRRGGGGHAKKERKGEEKEGRRKGELGRVVCVSVSCRRVVMRKGRLLLPHHEAEARESKFRREGRRKNLVFPHPSPSSSHLEQRLP